MRSRKHGNGFNPYWHGRMLDLVRERKVTAVYYAYIIAKLARRAIGAQDCDAAASGDPLLCSTEALLPKTLTSAAARTVDECPTSDRFVSVRRVATYHSAQ